VAKALSARSSAAEEIRRDVAHTLLHRRQLQSDVEARRLSQVRLSLTVRRGINKWRDRMDRQPISMSFLLVVSAGRRGQCGRSQLQFFR
jgi:hypothetical protein